MWTISDFVPVLSFRDPLDGIGDPKTATPDFVYVPSIGDPRDGGGWVATPPTNGHLPFPSPLCKVGDPLVGRGYVATQPTNGHLYFPSPL